MSKGIKYCFISLEETTNNNLVNRSPPTATAATATTTTTAGQQLCSHRLVQRARAAPFQPLDFRQPCDTSTTHPHIPQSHSRASIFVISAAAGWASVVGAGPIDQVRSVATCTSYPWFIVPSADNSECHGRPAFSQPTSGPLGRQPQQHVPRVGPPRPHGVQPAANLANQCVSRRRPVCLPSPSSSPRTSAWRRRATRNPPGSTPF
jgi:hypothetical protein